MRILIFTFLLFFGSINISVTQILPNRYVEMIVDTVTETTHVQFSTGVPVPQPGGGTYEWLTGYPLNVDEWDIEYEDLEMNIFQPKSDTIIKRPLVIICFGGGFLAGSKDHWSIREIGIYLAARGYVTAVIDYRLGMNIFDADLSKRAVYRGLQDGRSAVRYFKADANGSNTYKIDTNNIYMGGHSAGAFIAMHNAYLDKDIERPISTYSWYQDGYSVPDQLCLDCVGDNTSYNGQARAVFSLAGALGDTTYIESSTDPKANMFHSEDDGTVPIVSGTPFSGSLWLVIGDDLPDVYGSGAASIRANNVSADHIFNYYTNRGHDVHEETSTALYDDIIPKIADSFYIDFLKPINHPIQGNTIVCNDYLTQIYDTIDDEDTRYYDWTIIGGTINNLNILSDQVEVVWDDLAPIHKIYLTPYSCHGARGDMDSLEIDMHTSIQNSWIASNGVWTDVSSWSLGYAPMVCEDVIFPDEGVAEAIFIPLGTDVSIRSLWIGENVSLTQLEGAKMDLLTGGNLVVKGSFEIRDQLHISHLNNPLQKHIDVIGEMKISGIGAVNTEE